MNDERVEVDLTNRVVRLFLGGSRIPIQTVRHDQGAAAWLARGATTRPATERRFRFGQVAVLERPR